MGSRRIVKKLADGSLEEVTNVQLDCVEYYNKYCAPKRLLTPIVFMQDASCE